MPDWTKAQENAIKARGSNILVSAAAGSGKTAVLVERVVQKILDTSCDVNLDELLVVTFTNAAAAEMKVRISNALSDVIKRHPHHTRAIKQLSLVPNAKICTIDSFCLNIVKEHFFKLDIEQDFRILDTSEALLIEQKAIEEVIEEMYENGGEEFRSLTELLSSPKNDSELIKTVRKIYNYMSSQPFPFEWLKRIGELYNPEIAIDDSIIKTNIIDEVSFILNYIKDTISFERSLLVKGDEMYEKYSLMLDSDEEQIDYLISSLSSDWNDVRAAFDNISFSRTPSKRGFDSDYKAILLEKRKLYSSSKSVISEQIIPLISASSDDIKKDNELLFPVFSSLIDLIRRYDERMLEIKKELGAYTFSDIEHFAIKLLFTNEEDGYKRTSLAEELCSQFKEILVDEYQDTNTAQDTLFEMLSNGSNRFMVGDVKQSIYRFRLAMPSIFNHKKEKFTPYDSESASNEQKIILDKNFRSRKDICEFTNFIFSQLMTKRIGELDYTAEEYLNYGASYPERSEPCVSINIIEAPEQGDKTENEAKKAAEIIIEKIRNKEQVFDGKVQRDINFGDFAVLLRSAKTSMPIYATVFSQYGIPSIANNRTNLFDNNEVSVLLSLLRVIDNPVQDIPLLAVLMSVFYGYSADELSKARVEFRADSLYSSVSRSDTFKRFISDVDRYKKYAASMSVENLIRTILSETSYLALISALGNSEQRRLNVLKLIDFAKTFDNGENVGLTAFIRFIDSVIESGLEIESAELTGADENAVNIMSVHKSKGLEYPVVILADTARKYNTEDERASLLLNNELGIGMKVNVEEGLYRYNSAQYNLIRTVNSNAAVSENLRVLYVAITRAKEQLIVLSSFKNAVGRINKLSARLTDGKVTPYAVKKTDCDADLLLMCALRHKDCDALREFSITDIETDKAFSFPIDLNLCEVTEDSEVKLSSAAESDSELVEKIREKLSFSYNRGVLSAFSSKRTASSLDNRERSFKYFASGKPSFMMSDKLTSAQKGTALHAFMQYCRYDKARESIEKEIEYLKVNGFISTEQADSLDRGRLEVFFSSKLAKRMLNSDKLYREFKVTSFVPVCELEDTDFTDNVLVQGIADCVFEEDGKLVLVDYKTDKAQDESELLDMYKKQIGFYKTAVSKALGKEVKEAMLYSFELGRECRY